MRATSEPVPPADPRFELIEEIGRGGMGIVYRARDRQGGGVIALKALREVGPSQVLRLKREFRAMCDVRHPNLVRVGELFERDLRWFFTMELVEGVDFLTWVGAGGADASDEPSEAPDATGPATRIEPAAAHAIAARQMSSESQVTRTIDERAPIASAAPPRPPPPELRPPPAFDERRLRAALRGVADGLVGLHEAGLVHRDVKPSNIRIEASGRVVLLDFGVAAALDEDAEIAGTLAYMAPEQAAGRATPATDWYAVGVMLFRAITGRLPFASSRGGLALKAVLPAPTVDEYVRDVPDDLALLCTQLLAIDPAARAGAREVRAMVGPDLPLRAPAAAPPSFVGRARERARLDALRERRGCRVALIVGPSGVGKTALARRFLDDVAAADPSLLVFEGRCDERETVPFNALDGVVDGIARWIARAGDDLSPRVATRLAGRDAAELRRLFPVLAELATAPAPRRLATVDDPRAVAVSALRALIAAIAGDRTLAILIDDAHWADADSVGLLAELLAPPAPRLLLVVTARGPEAPPLVRDLWVTVESIALTGLDRDDARALAAAVGGAAAVDAGAIAREADGHPMFITELARFAAEHRTPASSLDDALWARACDLSVAARRALHVAVTAGAALPRAVAIDAAGLAPAEADDAIAELRAAHLLRAGGADDDVEPYHDRVREALTGRLAPAEQAAVHLAVARALVAGDAAPERVAHHWAAGGEPARAADAAEAAAARAAETFAFERAADWLAMALALGTRDADARRALLAARASALAHAGHPHAAGEAYLEAARTGEPSPHDRRELQRLAAERLLVGGYMTEGLAVARELFGQVGLSWPATRNAAIVNLVWHQARLGISRLRWTPRDESALAPDERLRLDTCWSAAIGLSMSDPIRGAAFAARAPVLSLRAGEPRRIALSLAAAAFAAAGMNRRKLLGRLTDAIARAVAQTDAPEARCYVTLAEAARAYFFDNDWAATASYAERGLEAWTEAGGGHTWEADLFEQFIAWALSTMGDYQRLAAHIDRVVRGARRRGDRFLEIAFRVQFPQGHLIADRPDDAARDVRDALASWVVPDDVDPIGNQFFWSIKSRTIIALYAGRCDVDGAALADDWAQLERGMLWRVPAVRVEASVWRCAIALARAAAVAPGPPRRALIADARRRLRMITRSPLPIRHVLEIEIGAAIAHLEGDDASAIERLRVAIPKLDAGAMPSTAASARWRLGQLVGGDEGAALIEAARAWLGAQDVKRPERIVAATLPGFED